VLFALGATDRKFPTLEDAWLLRHLLINYAPVIPEERFLLLKAKSCDPPRLTLAAEGGGALTERIDLSAGGTGPLWLEIDLHPTWLGRLRQFLYRPPTVRLAAWGADGKLLLRRRAPLSMLAAGFLISPLLTGNADVMKVYRGEEVRRPAACSIELLKGEEYLWQESVHFRLYRIENHFGQKE